MISWSAHRSFLVVLLLFTTTPWLWSAPISDIANTKHNLSITGPGPVKAQSESQICVFCHTPHGAENIPGAPLWNRKESGAMYTPYISQSIDANDIAATPGGSSKLCLSCHDGTVALGAVNVANGLTDVTLSLTGTGIGDTMPAGPDGEETGYTRKLGTDLTNDHPISFTYDSTLALNDGELRDPAFESHIGNRISGVDPVVPLENNQLECVSCHDPHIRDSDPAVNIKFLRLNRFQVAAPMGGGFNETEDIVCLGCHDKLGQAWSSSAHANPADADETYLDSAATQREFPQGIRVWEAACLNCHDTHTVAGSRRLLREGTDALDSPKTGGASAIEETCYQCHSVVGQSILAVLTEVPDIKTDFLLPRHMPITTGDQQAVSEVHDITDGDFSETPSLLGKGANLFNRHAECTDCHNPHRLMKNRLFNGNGGAVAATHEHAASHSNIASGALRGAWGVEPVYGSASFHVLPSNYIEKKGDGGTGASTAVTNPYVTREYQICLKCHSDFAYDDNNVYPIGNRPALGDSGGGTPLGVNGLTQYTNQAREFQAPLAHKGETSTSDSGAGSGFTTNNYRSWHPVIDDTGRTTTIRQAAAAAWLPPWDGVADIGNQTMYCSDCHGSNTGTTTVVPNGGENGSPWGPHGSTNDFILKGNWNGQTGGQSRDVPATDPNNGLCFKCHDFRTYADRNGNGNSSGFGGSVDSNLHAFHADKIERLQCMWCHVAVPHGWKNKALLVNLNDVGPEAGLAPGTQVRNNTTAAYNQEPYYNNALLKIVNFATSGNWEETNCGSAGSPGNGQTGRDWMRDSNENCQNPP